MGEVTPGGQPLSRLRTAGGSVAVKPAFLKPDPQPVRVPVSAEEEKEESDRCDTQIPVSIALLLLVSCIADSAFAASSVAVTVNRVRPGKGLVRIALVNKVQFHKRRKLKKTSAERCRQTDGRFDSVSVQGCGSGGVRHSGAAGLRRRRKHDQQLAGSSARALGDVQQPTHRIRWAKMGACEVHRHGQLRGGEGQPRLEVVRGSDGATPSSIQRNRPGRNGAGAPSGVFCATRLAASSPTE